jgi:hypothetical protein
MDIESLGNFFMWCTILNACLLVFSFLMLAYTGDFVYQMHGKCFPMPRERFNEVVYAFISFYKILIIVFNFVPWNALEIIK